jgi:hypothetical protein
LASVKSYFRIAVIAGAYRTHRSTNPASATAILVSIGKSSFLSLVSTNIEQALWKTELQELRRQIISYPRDSLAL